MVDRARGTTYQRGYDKAHTHLRAHWVPIVATGTVRCTRCGRTIHPDAAWDLGHEDGDRSRHRGPEHADCNRGRRPVSGPPDAA